MNEHPCLDCTPALVTGTLGHRAWSDAKREALGECALGECIGEPERDESFNALVSLRLSPRGTPADERLCRATVDFLTAFWDERFAAPHSEDSHPDALCATFGFVFSELLENAFKFNQGGDLHISLGVGGWEWGCRVSNQVSADTVPELCAQLHELSRAEPGSLLRSRAEANARHPERGNSGLGVLLLREYGVRLGWTLQPLSRDQVRVETRARVSLLALQALGGRRSGLSR